MVPITWRAEEGHVRPETTATDASGIARSRWTLGSQLGPARVIVLVPGVALADTFTATVRAGHGVRLFFVREAPPWIVLSDSLAILPSDSLAILASVKDRAGNTLPSPFFEWSSSDPQVATVSTAGPVHPPAAPGQLQFVIHARTRARICSGAQRRRQGLGRSDGSQGRRGVWGLRSRAS